MRRLRTTRSPAWKPILDRATTFSVGRASSSPNASPATSCSAAVVGCGGRVHVSFSWQTSEILLADLGGVRVIDPHAIGRWPQR
jgi:hypothetical protein